MLRADAAAAVHLGDERELRLRGGQAPLRGTPAPAHRPGPQIPRRAAVPAGLCPRGAAATAARDAPAARGARVLGTVHAPRSPSTPGVPEPVLAYRSPHRVLLTSSPPPRPTPAPRHPRHTAVLPRDPLTAETPPSCRARAPLLYFGVRRLARAHAHPLPTPPARARTGGAACGSGSTSASTATRASPSSAPTAPARYAGPHKPSHAVINRHRHCQQQGKSPPRTRLLPRPGRTQPGRTPLQPPLRPLPLGPGPARRAMRGSPAVVNARPSHLRGAVSAAGGGRESRADAAARSVAIVRASGARPTDVRGGRGGVRRAA